MKKRLSLSKEEASFINVTPLIDVLLVLVAILILAMPAVVKSINVDIPSASAKNELKNTKMLVVSADGRLSVDDVEVKLTDIKTKLSGLNAVNIVADQKLSYAKLSSILSELQNANISAIEFSQK